MSTVSCPEWGQFVYKESCFFSVLSFSSPWHIVDSIVFVVLINQRLSFFHDCSTI